MHDRAAVRSTPVVLLIFLIVFYRWLEMFTGWSEAVLLPLTAMAGTVLLDALILPPGSRLTPRGWALNVGVAALVGVLLGFLQRS